MSGLYRLLGERRPITVTLPLYSCSRTSPLTGSWVLSINDCKSSISGLNQ